MSPDQNHSTPYFSVVIPTYNRCEVLVDCLCALANQTIAMPKFEVIVIDDGSSDQTPLLIEKAQTSYPFDFTFLRQKNSGPATARNAGVQQARGEIILFLGDDIIAEPDLLYQHEKWHLIHKAPHDAVLGFVTWDPLNPITPFMQWLENGGPQFNYSGIKGTRANYGFFYTCNLSIKKQFLITNGLFDPDFKHAAYEDTELAYRLEKKGMVLHYHAKAQAWHRHPTTLASSRKRMRIIGQSAALVEQKHPELRFIEEFEKAVANGPHRSAFWNFLHNRIASWPLPVYLSQRIAWRAHEYYRSILSQEAIQGYRNAPKSATHKAHSA